ncbi:MAG: hypothetical protein HY840_01295 [Bacteroidetes bacterium]|nr:hypothetical protein [Bacteroidota bacterium]
MLYNILQEVTKQDNIIFIISNESWGDVWYSKQHYANELSKNNHVFFVNPPARWKFFNLFSFASDIKKISASLSIINYQNNFPVLPILKTWTRYLNDVCNSHKLKRAIKDEVTNKPVIFWQFDPFRFIHIFFLKNKKRIYHVVDPYLKIETDKNIALKSDLIILTSSKYIEHYKVLNKNIIHIPHGISGDELTTNREIVDELRGVFGNFILLIGTINDRVNLHLLKKIATSFPQNNLIIIGPRFFQKSDNALTFESLIKCKNVKYLGIIHAKKLNNYTAASRVCILSYYTEENEFCLGTPLKVSSYIAQKKMIVSSTFFYDLLELNKKIIYLTSQTDEFLNYLKSALENNLYYDSELAKEYIEKTSYEKLISTIFISINNLK